MKKFIFTIIAAILCIVSINILGKSYKSKIYHKEVAVIEQSSIKQYVTASGKIEYDTSKDIKSPSQAITNSIYVKESDKVEKNDIIATVTLLNDDIAALQAISNIEYNQIKDYISDMQAEVYNIYAPCSGTISSVNTEANEYISADDSIASMNVSNNMSVTLNISEARINNIEVGQKVEITGVGFKDIECSGTVTNIANEAKQTATLTGKETTVAVTVNIDETNEKILKGFTATCKIITSEKECITVPYTAIRADNNGDEYVFIVNNGISEKRYVKSGFEDIENIEIISGLECGDTIIVNAENLEENDYIIME